MPQLSPMMGFMFFLAIILSYYIFAAGASKAPSKVSHSKKSKSTPPFELFLWDGSINAWTLSVHYDLGLSSSHLL